MSLEVTFGRKRSCGTGEAEKSTERSKRHRRRYLPSASASSLVGSRCHPRISSWTESFPSAVEKSLSPIQNSGLPARYFRPRINSALHCLHPSGVKTGICPTKFPIFVMICKQI